MSETAKARQIETSQAVWRGITLEIRFERNWLGSKNMPGITAHLEVESLSPPRAKLPITETGYRSHFMQALDLIDAGGPVTFVTAWIEQEAKGKTWTKAAAAKAQGDLFNWAEAKDEVGKRKRASKPKSPSARVSRNRGRDRAPEDCSRART